MGGHLLMGYFGIFAPLQSITVASELGVPGSFPREVVHSQALGCSGVPHLVLMGWGDGKAISASVYP